jgi:MoxR-like ATPase
MERGVYEREEATRLAFLATAAGESVFFLGPPGVAKSLIARRLKFAFRDATSFEYLMGRFSTPDEIFGPISIQRLKEEDRYERITDHYLPDADIVFLDEIWKAGPPIQNALLTALNEKRFRNGTREVRIPMKGLVSASNHIPETDAGQRAFWDRFLVRVPLRAIEDDASFYRLLTDAADEYEDTVPAELKIDTEEHERWQREIAAVSVPAAVLHFLSRLRRRLAAPAERDAHEPMYISDRRWKKVAGLLRTSAFLNGREAVDTACGTAPRTSRSSTGSSPRSLPASSSARRPTRGWSRGSSARSSAAFASPPSRPSRRRPSSRCSTAGSTCACRGSRMPRSPSCGGGISMRYRPRRAYPASSSCSTRR